MAAMFLRYSAAGQLPEPPHFGREVLELAAAHTLDMGSAPSGAQLTSAGRMAATLGTSSRHQTSTMPSGGWLVMRSTAAFRAVLPVADARFHEVADRAGARGNPDVFGLPQAERIHGSGRQK